MRQAYIKAVFNRAETWEPVARIHDQLGDRSEATSASFAEYEAERYPVVRGRSTSAHPQALFRLWLDALVRSWHLEQVIKEIEYVYPDVEPAEGWDAIRARMIQFRVALARWIEWLFSGRSYRDQIREINLVQELEERAGRPLSVSAIKSDLQRWFIRMKVKENWYAGALIQRIGDEELPPLDHQEGEKTGRNLTEQQQRLQDLLQKYRESKSREVFWDIAAEIDIELSNWARHNTDFMLAIYHEYERQQEIWNTEKHITGITAVNTHFQRAWHEAETEALQQDQVWRYGRSDLPDTSGEGEDASNYETLAHLWVTDYIAAKASDQEQLPPFRQFAREEFGYEFNSPDEITIHRERGLCLGRALVRNEYDPKTREDLYRILQTHCPGCADNIKPNSLWKSLKELTLSDGSSVREDIGQGARIPSRFVLKDPAAGGWVRSLRSVQVGRLAGGY